MEKDACPGIKVLQRKERFVHPHLWYMQTCKAPSVQEMHEAGRQQYQLSVEVHRLRFTYHPSMTEEEALVQQFCGASSAKGAVLRQES